MFLKNIIKLCRFSKDSVDDGALPIQQIEYQGKTGDSLRIMPYGLDANIPEDALGILLNLLSQEQNRVVLPISPKERPKNLEVGELVLYHPLTGSKVYFQKSGKISIETEDDVDIICKDAVITASGQVTVDSPEVTFTGNATVDGDLSVTGDTELGTTVTSNGVNIGETHSHTQANDSNGNVEQPVGVPF